MKRKQTQQRKRGLPMSDNNETREDIVAEMRKLGKLDEKSTDKMPRRLMGLGLRTYADRLEAAAEREFEPTTDKSSVVGNAAAMREALDKAHRVLHRAIIAGILRCDDAYDAMNMAAAALSAPARNCDVGTQDDQEERFTKVCVANSKDGVRGLCSETCTFGRDYQGECALAWAQMPYEAAGKGAGE